MFFRSCFNNNSGPIRFFSTNYDQLNAELESILLDEVLNNSSNIQDIVNQFYDILRNKIDKYVPEMSTLCNTTEKFN